MNPIVWFGIIGAFCLIVLLPQFIFSKVKRVNDTPKLEIEPFSVTEYFDRMEQTAINILEKQEPVDQTIILWWGLDGIRLNENGTLEWISRKKPNPVTRNIFYQPCQSIQTWPDQSQSTRAQIEELMNRNASLQIQVTQPMQNAAMISMLSPPITPAYPCYSLCMQLTYLQSSLASPLTQCYQNTPAIFY